MPLSSYHREIKSSFLSELDLSFEVSNLYLSWICFICDRSAVLIAIYFNMEFAQFLLSAFKLVLMLGVNFFEIAEFSHTALQTEFFEFLLDLDL